MLPQIYVCIALKKEPFPDNLLQQYISTEIFFTKLNGYFIDSSRLTSLSYIECTKDRISQLYSFLKPG